MRDGLSLFCLVYVTGVTMFLVRPLELLRDILARVDPERGMWMVEDLGRSVGAERVLLLNAVVLMSDNNTLALEPPAGLSNEGESLTVELLLPPRYLLGGLPLGALTGDTPGCLAEPALRERFGDTTAAAAAIRESPDVPWRSMLFTS